MVFQSDCCETLAPFSVKPQVVFPHQYVLLVAFLAASESLCRAVPAEGHKIALITLECDMLGFAMVMED